MLLYTRKSPKKSTRPKKSPVTLWENEISRAVSGPHFCTFSLLACYKRFLGLRFRVGRFFQGFFSAKTNEKNGFERYHYYY